MRSDEQIDNWKCGRNLMSMANVATSLETEDTIVSLAQKKDAKAAAYQRELTRLVETLGAAYTQILETTGRAKKHLDG